jgi:hypothetical protein
MQVRRDSRGGMKYEIREDSGEWIVQRDGVEVARFAQQDEALADIAERLREKGPDSQSYSLTMRYQPRN